MHLLWERYFLREVIKTLSLLIVLFFGLYVLIDYSVHANMFHRAGLSVGSIATFYFCEFSKRLDVLLPFSILAATIKTLCDLSTHNELVALMASGIPLRRLLRPFVMVGLVGTTVIYLNSQLVLPTAQDALKTLASNPAIQQKQGHKKTAVQQLVLPDQTSLLYLNYDPVTQTFHHAYWISNFNELHHMKVLHPFETPPRGEYVTHFLRDHSGSLVEKGIAKEIQFNAMPFEPDKLWKSVVPPEEQSLTTLLGQLPHNVTAFSEKDAHLVSALIQKLMIPWLCLLAVMAPAPFCTQFSRQSPIYFIYAFSLFGFIALYLMLSAASVLSARQVLNPFFILGAPLLFSIMFTTYCWRTRIA